MKARFSEVCPEVIDNSWIINGVSFIDVTEICQKNQLTIIYTLVFSKLSARLWKPV